MQTIKSMIQFAQEQTVEDVLPQDKAQGCDDSEWD